MKRRYILLIVFLWACWLIAALSVEPESANSYSAKPGGTKAFFMLLEKQGLKPERWLEPYSLLSVERQGATLLVIDPAQGGGEKDLSKWVRAGGRLLLFGGKTALSSVLGTDSTDQEGELQPRPFDVIAEQFKNLTEQSLHVSCPKLAACRGVSNISRMTGPVPLPEGSISMAASALGMAYVFKTNIEKGEIWFFSSSDPILNSNIDKFDNLRLLFQIAGAGGPILFDDFHHGFLKPLSPQEADRAQQLVVAAIILSVALAIAALSRAFRFGEPTPLPASSASGAEEFASAVGLLYCEHGANETLTHYAAAWKQRMLERFSLSPFLPDHRLLEELRRRGIIDTEASAAIARTLAAIQRDKSTAIADPSAIVASLERASSRSAAPGSLDSEKGYS